MNSPDLPNVFVIGTGFWANNPTEISPQIPPIRCTDKAPMGSSRPILSQNGMAMSAKNAAKAPTSPEM